jgi:hypothetical protein
MSFPDRESKIRALVETAEDDRVIGIPHTMTTSGDKIYIINGRVNFPF